MKVLHDLNKHEIPLCILFNRVNQYRPISMFFCGVSRLGNGVFWYVLILMLPVIHGREAIPASLHMTVAGLIGYAVYKRLKTTTKRLRPYHFNQKILRHAPALDKFSFPSGHVQHAVCFTVVVLYYYPEWTMLVVPFTVLIALSRVVLGLHYPSDVVIGAVVGGTIAQCSIFLLS